MIETILIVLCAVPDNEEAKLIARTLLKKKLAACCNIIPAVQSVSFFCLWIAFGKQEIQTDRHQ